MSARKSVRNPSSASASSLPPRSLVLSSLPKQRSIRSAWQPGPYAAIKMDPRHSHYPAGRRSPVFNPARASLPAGLTGLGGYGSAYAGDVHAVPTTRHESVAPRHHHHLSDYRTNSVPTTTTTYAVRKDPVPAPRSSAARDSSRVRRSSTLDSNHKRPIIVTTSQTGARPHVAAAHPASARPDSPMHDPYRSSEEYYTQPASSMRSRSHNRSSYRGAPYSAALDDDEYHRLRERTGDDRLLAPRADGRYAPRPAPVYPKIPRAPTGTNDYGNDGYEYTKPSDLARYDLENETGSSHRRRRDSFDRNYHRPSVSVSTDLGRPYDGRPRGPPPTTWGLDRINRRPEDSTSGIYDRPQVRMPLPPPAPLGLAPTDVVRRPARADVPPSPTELRGTGRARPVSLYQEGPHRHHDDYYRAREDELIQKEILDRDRERGYFHDDDVTVRGFGLRTDADKLADPRRQLEYRERDREPERDRERDRDRDRERERERERDRELDRDDHSRDERLPVRERREEPRRERLAAEDRDPRRRSEEIPPYPRDDRKEPASDRKYARDEAHREDDLRDRKPSKDDGDRDGDGREKSKLRDKVATGLGLAATAIGLGPLKDKDDKPEKDGRTSSRRRRESDEERRRLSDDDERGADRHKPSRRDVEDRKASLRDELDDAGYSQRARQDRPALDEPDAKERNRREAEAKLNGEPPEQATREGNSASDEPKDVSRPRRQRPSSAFRPGDTADLMALKAQLKAMDEAEKDKENPPLREPSSDRRAAPPPAKREPPAESSSREDSRGRELVVSPDDRDKQVRVVSPPRDKDEKKPIKGILKPPSNKFPEEPNPIREGVAPHKDDKTKQDVPPGARWTKISRKLVNPEALTIGKERFEVRDDFVIVLRVLSREEIEAYTAATAQLRDMRRKELEKEAEKGRGDDDDDRRRAHRSHRRDPRDEEEDEKRYRERERDGERGRERDGERDRERDRREDRHRRHRHHSDEDDRAADGHGHGHHRSRSHREREAVVMSD